MGLVTNSNKLTMKAVQETRFFVPEKIYNERRQNFLKNAAFVAKYNVRLILAFDLDEKSVYEFRLKNETVSMTIWDFLLPFFKIKGKGLYFDQFQFLCDVATSQYKILIEPPKNRVGCIVQWLN